MPANTNRWMNDGERSDACKHGVVPAKVLWQRKSAERAMRTHLGHSARLGEAPPRRADAWTGVEPVLPMRTYRKRIEIRSLDHISLLGVRRCRRGPRRQSQLGAGVRVWCSPINFQLDVERSARIFMQHLVDTYLVHASSISRSAAVVTHAGRDARGARGTSGARRAGGGAKA
eukprot:5878720-Prymnesium_polylepis.1